MKFLESINRQLWSPADATFANSTELRGVGVDSQVQDRSADTFRMQPIVEMAPVVIQRTRAHTLQLLLHA